MDGTPSSEGSDSTAKTPRAIATPTTLAAISSSSSTAAKTTSATSFPADSVKTPASLTPSQPISSSAAFDSVKQSNVSNGTLYKRSDLADRIRAFPSCSPSATASSAETRSTPSTAQVLNTPSTANSEIPRPRALRHTAPNSLTTSSLVDVVPTTEAASASRGLPANFARPAHKTYYRRFHHPSGHISIDCHYSRWYIFQYLSVCQLGRKACRPLFLKLDSPKHSYAQGADPFIGNHL